MTFDIGRRSVRSAHTAAHGALGGRGQVWFAVDQPSTVFASFANPHITAVGATLDAKLAELIEHLGLAVPAALRPTAVRRGTS